MTGQGLRTPLSASGPSAHQLPHRTPPPITAGRSTGQGAGQGGHGRAPDTTHPLIGGVGPSDGPLTPARKGRETVALKAARLLLSGRVAVLLVHRGRVMAQVRGDSGASYHCGRDPRRGWWCHCPAKGDKCSHVAALKLVVDLARLTEGEVTR
jgi:hypothetical protein